MIRCLTIRWYWILLSGPLNQLQGLSTKCKNQSDLAEGFFFFYWMPAANLSPQEMLPRSLSSWFGLEDVCGSGTIKNEIKTGMTSTGSGLRCLLRQGRKGMPSTINLKEKTGYEGLRGSVNRCNLQFSAGLVDREWEGWSGKFTTVFTVSVHVNHRRTGQTAEDGIRLYHISHIRLREGKCIGLYLPQWLQKKSGHLQHSQCSRWRGRF